MTGEYYKNYTTLEEKKQEKTTNFHRNNKMTAREVMLFGHSYIKVTSPVYKFNHWLNHKNALKTAQPSTAMCQLRTCYLCMHG